MGDVKVTVPITLEGSITQILRWILFTAYEQKESIYDDSNDSFNDNRISTDTDISDLSTDFEGRTQDIGKYTLGCANRK